MLYYRIKENKLYDYSDYKYAEECLDTDIVTKEQIDKEPFIVTVQDDVLILNPDYEEIKEEIEKDRISKLSLTKREVFLALYHAKQITPDMLKAQITNPEALIEFEYANDYYRGNPLIDTIGGMLGYSSADLDYLFEHKEFPEVVQETVEE